jgi:hypothetical protein
MEMPLTKCVLLYIKILISQLEIFLISDVVALKKKEGTE